MKITKERLKEIIFEEIEQANSENDKEATITKQKLREKFKMLYQNILKVKGLSKNELVVFNALLDSALTSMQSSEATPDLKRALDKLQK